MLIRSDSSLALHHVLDVQLLAGVLLHEFEEIVELLDHVIDVSLDGTLVRAAYDLRAVEHEYRHLELLGLNLEPLPVGVADGVGAGDDVGLRDAAQGRLDVQCPRRRNWSCSRSRGRASSPCSRRARSGAGTASGPRPRSPCFPGGAGRCRSPTGAPPGSRRRSTRSSSRGGRCTAFPRGSTIDHRPLEVLGVGQGVDPDLRGPGEPVQLFLVHVCHL